MITNPRAFPGGSRNRVNRAGNNVRNDSANSDDFGVIDEWRAAHSAVLNTFQAILRGRTRGTEIIMAQRHKRKSTIFGKLLRHPEMQLGRMDDVAGCRLIFPDIDLLQNFRKKFHSARFRHSKKNEVDKYDYIKNPKSTGYRGIHDVYVYDVNSDANRHLKGLMIEIQYRTKIQHAWATAVEVIGFITESQPKFQAGDSRYTSAMALASEILARAYEELKGPFPDRSDVDLVKEFLEFDKELGLISMLRGLNASSAVSKNGNTILIFSKAGELTIKTFRDSTDALRELFFLEKSQPENDIVLVRADSSEEVRFAFRNYFSDAQDFLSLFENACQKLSGRIGDKILFAEQMRRDGK